MKTCAINNRKKIIENHITSLSILNFRRKKINNEKRKPVTKKISPTKNGVLDCPKRRYNNK
jgi:hypothetical protein